MATFEIALNAFAYAEDLPNRKANFRFIVAIHFQDRGCRARSVEARG